MKTFSNERLQVVCLSVLAVALLACGAQTAGPPGGDGGLTETGASDALSMPDTITFGNADARADAGGLEVQPTTSIESTVAFGELQGTYTGQAKNVAGSSLAAFDDGASYTFVIDPNGTVSFATKAGSDVYTWAAHGKRITRNNANQVTALVMEEDNKRVLTITYRPSTGPFDIAGVAVEPEGRWYLTTITKAP